MMRGLCPRVCWYVGDGVAGGGEAGWVGLDWGGVQGEVLARLYDYKS